MIDDMILPALCTLFGTAVGTAIGIVIGSWFGFAAAVRKINEVEIETIKKEINKWS